MFIDLTPRFVIHIVRCFRAPSAVGASLNPPAALLDAPERAQGPASGPTDLKRGNI